MVRQGQIWLVALDPTRGSEIRKTRPCLVVTPDTMNRRIRTPLFAPLTSKGHPASWRVPVRWRDRDALILLDQMRALDVDRLIRNQGDVDPDTLVQVLDTLQVVFA